MMRLLAVNSLYFASCSVSLLISLSRAISSSRLMNSRSYTKPVGSRNAFSNRSLCLIKDLTNLTETFPHLKDSTFGSEYSPLSNTQLTNGGHFDAISYVCISHLRDYFNYVPFRAGSSATAQGLRVLQPCGGCAVSGCRPDI